MMLKAGAAIESTRADHPWIADFERDPKRFFDKIIRGVALIHPFGLADPLTVLPTMFGSREPDDSLLRILDRTAADWIAERRCLSHAERLQYGIKRYVRDVVDALALAQALPLSATRAMLRTEYFLYVRWASALILSTANDPLSRLWLALAEEQPDARFRALWYRICRQTGESLYPQHYLGIGLLGLRRLPGDEKASLNHALGGLCAWAAALPDEERSQGEFVRQWQALQWIYTRPGRSAWRRLAEPVLFANRRKPFFKWWRNELRMPSAAHRRSRAWLPEPPLAEVDALDREICTAWSEHLKPRIWGAIQIRREWAETTGNAHPLVLTAGRLGNMLIDHAPALAVEMVVLALDWEPGNEILWNLWGRGLNESGREKLAEAVLWEACRRFPEGDHSFVELGKLLADQRRWDEAETVLRKTAGFATSKHAHVELARVLAARKRLTEAEAILRRTPDFATSQHAHVELARVLIASRRLPEAEVVLRQTPGLADSEHANVFLARVKTSQGDPCAAIECLNAFLEGHPQSQFAAETLYALYRRTSSDEKAEALRQRFAGFDMPLTEPEALTADGALEALINDIERQFESVRERHRIDVSPGANADIEGQFESVRENGLLFYGALHYDASGERFGFVDQGHSHSGRAADLDAEGAPDGDDLHHRALGQASVEQIEHKESAFVATADTMLDGGSVAEAHYHALSQDARVTRADFGLSPFAEPYIGEERRAELQGDLEALLAEEQDHVYAQLVYFDRIRPRDLPAEGIFLSFSSVYELRLLVALNHSDREALDKLLKDEPQRAPVTALALMALGIAEQKYTHCVLDWLTEPAPAAADLLARYVYKAVRSSAAQVGASINDPASVGKVLANMPERLVEILRTSTRLVGTREAAA